MRAVYLLASCLFSLRLVVAQPEATLKVGTKTYTAFGLLKRGEIETIAVMHDPAYGGREMRYQAIPAAALFTESNLREDDVVQFRCLDGFVATISKERIMRSGPGQSVAYIAIENPKSKWPDRPLKSASGSAGPFYLIWLNPELSGILQEEWPYQIVAFEVKGSLQNLYPRIFPRRQEDARVARGLKLFQQTCFACHTLNREGPAQVGPDLNLPFNPTEYLKETILPRYIRDPKSIRAWEGSKMPGFGPETFSDDDIASIIAYLKEMALEKTVAE
ncbi:MAG TPA: cytochrome c [Verrucomicrobiae bacterium]|nr:cytochrome c [Verrucomicrobiae bacterium]